jgi:hypothetical protein
VKILMDESGNGNGSQPLIVGAVELGDDADDVEQLVRDLYKRLGTRRDLAGMPGFEEFREKGFHSATDPVEVSVPFLELIRSLIFRAYMVVTDRTRVPGRTELQRIEYMYVKLLSDLLIRYRNDESELICCIEQNQGLGPIVDRLPDTATKRAYATLGKVAQLPELKISIVTKTECMSAVADGWLERRSTLLTTSEADYINYFLNQSGPTGGPDLRNRYLHGSQADGDDKAVHLHTYLIALRLLIALVIKLNDDLSPSTQTQNP